MNIIQSHIEQAERNEELHAVLKINDPDKPNPKMPLNRDAWLQYQNLQKCAKESRNDLATDQVKRDYEYCLQELDGFKKYIKTQGIQLKG